MLLSIISIVSAITTDYVYYSSSFVSINRNMLTPYAAMIEILAITIPILEFSFKMNKNTVDAFYSLPIKRNKFFLTKYTVVLLEVLIPFTITYFIMVVLVQFKENRYVDLYFFLYYIEIIAAGTILYSIISFIYTKANTMFDGLILILLYFFIGELFAHNLELIIHAIGNKS